MCEISWDVEQTRKRLPYTSQSNITNIMQTCIKYELYIIDEDADLY